MNLTIRVLDKNREVLGSVETPNNDGLVSCKMSKSGRVDSIEYELLGCKVPSEIEGRPLKVYKGERVTIMPIEKKFISLYTS